MPEESFLDYLIDLENRLLHIANWHADYLFSFYNTNKNAFKRNIMNPNAGVGLTSTCYAIASILQNPITTKKFKELAKDEKVYEKIYEFILEKIWRTSNLEPFNIYTIPIVLLAVTKLDDETNKLKESIDWKIFLSLHKLIKNIKNQGPNGEYNGAAKYDREHPVSSFLTHRALESLSHIRDKFEKFDKIDLKNQLERCKENVENVELYKKENAPPHEKETKLDDDELKINYQLDSVNNFQQKQIIKEFLAIDNNFDFVKEIKVVEKISTKWALEKLNEQFSYYDSKDTTRQDPTRTVYSLAIYDKYWEDTFEKDTNKQIINSAISHIFDDQQDDGLWGKYLPVLSIPKYQGNVYPFSLATLDTLLTVSKPTTSIVKNFKENIERSLDWITTNKRHSVKRKIFGWRSNHAPDPDGPPEAWSTSLIFDLINHLLIVVRKHINTEIIQDFEGYSSEYIENNQEFRKLDKFLDCNVLTKKDNNTHYYKLKEIIEKMFTKVTPDSRTVFSSIFFGPPGTRKTSLVRSIAREMEWNYVEIRTSHLAREGRDKVTASIGNIFQKLNHLENAVILLDEIDEFIKKRDNPDLDNRLMTNEMLTRLQDLHDKGKCIVIINTNNIESIDDAISRPGRIDCKLCIGTPDLKNYKEIAQNIEKKYNKKKLQHITKILDKQHNSISDLICDSVTSTTYNEKIRFFTIKEWENFVYELLATVSQRNHEKDFNMNKKQELFDTTLAEWVDSIIMRKSDKSESPYKKYIDHEFDSRIPPEIISNLDIHTTP